MNIAEIVKRARERKGLSRQQLSDKSGVCVQTIWNIENAKTNPTMDTMLVLMRAMDYDIVFKPKYKAGYYE